MDSEPLSHLGERKDIEDELPVSFRPPLFEQRRGWVLEILRKEQVTSLVDIGCGEGALLSCLCNPSMYLPIPIERNTPELDLINSHKPGLPELYITNIMGLDVSAGDLQLAATRTAPQHSDESTSSYTSARPRWEHLTITLFLGNFTTFNEHFLNAECMVCTEVIEHLPPDEFAQFAPMMFGTYKPRLLLLTTPSYTFNARFYPPDALLSSAKFLSTHFLDPTGRTNRFFRHHDHKFEWTREEFTMWCQTVASAYGYSVQIAGIGRSMETDPWGRDEELGCATQVALFRRLETHPDFNAYMEEAEEMEVLRDLEMDYSDRHQPFMKYYYSAHPSAGKFGSPQEISATAATLLKEYGRIADYTWTIYQIWVENRTSEVCGGRIDKLLEALFRSQELTVTTSSGSENVWGGWLNWIVRLRNPVVPDKQLEELEGILNGLDIAYRPPEQSLDVSNNWGTPDDPWWDSNSSSLDWENPWGCVSQDESDAPVDE